MKQEVIPKTETLKTYLGLFIYSIFQQCFIKPCNVFDAWETSEIEQSPPWAWVVEAESPWGTTTGRAPGMEVVPQKALPQ